MAHNNRAVISVVILHLLIISIHHRSSMANTVPLASLSNGNSSENHTSHNESASASGTKRSCTNVHPIFELRGFTAASIPNDPITDRPLRYCDVPPGGTCCTHTIENKLAVHAKTLLERNTKDSISKLSSVLGTRAQKFNDFFKQLLAESKAEFHAMFKRTYGTIYEQNAYVFADLFTELERYYANGKVDLGEAMDSFFNILYQKMFTVLNSQYSFNTKYLGCVSEHMKELKPFGDVPDKLSVQIKRSFVATRTFAQALNSAADVAKNMVNVRLSAECTATLTKMSTCNTCAGFLEKPCSSYCINVMKGCLQNYIELDNEWDSFVATMERVSDRLLGPFNIVMVVEPINIKISEAIMNFQETGQDISNRVFQGCGKPALGRRRRDTGPLVKPKINENRPDPTRGVPIKSPSFDDSDLFIFDEENFVGDKQITKRSTPDSTSRELKYDPVQFSNGEIQFTNSNNPPTQHQAQNENTSNNRNNKRKNNRKQSNEEENNREPIDRLVKDIRQRVKDSKRFWSNLPYMICNNEEMAAPPSSDGSCWNGQTVDRYLQNIASESDKNPEFPNRSTNTRQSAIVQQQLYVLRTAISQLRNAYNGHDVEWTDQEDNYYGSGSGGGSGFDDEDEAGSGLGPWEVDDRIHDRIPSGAESPNDVIEGERNSSNNGKNEIDYTSHRNIPAVVDGSSGGTSTSAGSGSKKSPHLSISRALLQFFLPLIMAWFGGIFADLL
ncbi:glypican-6 [Toxorhynchites rutilus septentrionalis]|uniref:glypican-6 n=1 Tax=Toxorhynchites rutilus septentrionalis TaxID=329112 RepID=UPI00247AD63A|nr:glypican-6 [Toxorhynchites rutilus septentrionalis]XP_055639121.1 glypican-6 [Toxorhynchites rutilus septentrionalis]